MAPWTKVSVWIVVRDVMVFISSMDNSLARFIRLTPCCSQKRTALKFVVLAWVLKWMSIWGIICLAFRIIPGSEMIMAWGAILPILSWPDLMVGAGLLGGSMILSLEQLLIDAETFRMYKQAHRGILTYDEMWLDDVIQRVGPGGNFLGEKSTRANMRSGEWLIPRLGIHETQKAWESAGKKDILEEAREKVDHLLATHKPLPLPSEVEAELLRIEQKARNFG